MEKIFTAKEMQAVDQTAIRDYGVPGSVLMENAGSGIVRAFNREHPDALKKKLFVVAGTGNNGGDGFVVARYFLEQGIRVQVALIGKLKQLKGDAALHAKIACKAGVSVLEVDSKIKSKFDHQLRHSDIVIDALFGTGLTRPITGFFAKIIKTINVSEKYVTSVDIPSGLDSDSGQFIGPHIQANETFALAGFKRSHLLFPAAEAVGTLHKVEIGIPQTVLDQSPDTLGLLEETDIRPFFKKRGRNTHKGTYGHLLVLAGSKGKGGAAGLSALAGLRGGAGLVTLACPESMVAAYEFNPLEAMLLPLPETASGALSIDALPSLLASMDNKAAIAIGPGLGTSASTQKLLETFIPKITLPLVIDADGLNILSKSKTLLKLLPAQTILTPHPKEMSRLIGMTTASVLKDPLGATQEFCQRHSVITLLKGAHSLVGFEDGRVRINPTGNPAMATAGVGDVLTGIIGSFLAQGMEPKQAVIAGIYIHGLCGDLAVQDNQAATLIASDLIQYLPKVLSQLQ